jgi:hypothetical protein
MMKVVIETKAFPKEALKRFTETVEEETTCEVSSKGKETIVTFENADDLRLIADCLDYLEDAGDEDPEDAEDDEDDEDA